MFFRTWRGKSLSAQLLLCLCLHYQKAHILVLKEYSVCIHVCVHISIRIQWLIVQTFFFLHCRFCWSASKLGNTRYFFAMTVVLIVNVKWTSIPLGGFWWGMSGELFVLLQCNIQDFGKAYGPNRFDCNRSY